GQAIDVSAGAGSVQPDKDDGVVRVRQRVDAGPGLRVAVDGQGPDDRRLSGGRRDYLHARYGDIEIDAVRRATRRRGVASHPVERHIDINIRLVVDRNDGFAERGEAIDRNRITAAGYRNGRRGQAVFELFHPQ